MEGLDWCYGAPSFFLQNSKALNENKCIANSYNILFVVIFPHPPKYYD